MNIISWSCLLPIQQIRLQTTQTAVTDIPATLFRLLSPRCPTATMLRPPLHVSLLLLSKLSRPSLPDNSWCKAATTAPRRCCHCPALLYLHCMLPAIDCCLLNGSSLQDNSCNATAPQWHGYHRSALLRCLLSQHVACCLFNSSDTVTCCVPTAVGAAMLLPSKCFIVLMTPLCCYFGAIITIWLLSFK